MNATFQVYEVSDTETTPTETVTLPELPTQGDVLEALGLSDDGEYRCAWLDLPSSIRVDTEDGLNMFKLVRI